jgi:hypothetical protein
MHNTFTTLLFIYIRLHVSALYGPSSGRYKLPSKLGINLVNLVNLVTYNFLMMVHKGPKHAGECK